MIKVITYGTFDLLHYGHIKLLERAKALGDYLIVGVTSDDYDKTRGKINNQQSLMERIAAVEGTGLADEVIVEEYEGQKIDDIRKYDVDIFTVGSDWVGYFDYLGEYCKVVYLPRTQGISSSDIRSEKNKLRMGVIGEPGSEHTSFKKFMYESSFVNGVDIVCSNLAPEDGQEGICCTEDLDELFAQTDAVYITSHPSKHYAQVKQALLAGKHVLCESPVTLKKSECLELFDLAQERGLVLMEAIKTAYTTAYGRLILLLKTGRIGDVVSVDATCTSLKSGPVYSEEYFAHNWNTITEWGPIGLLPVLQLLGTDYAGKTIVTRLFDRTSRYDLFTKIDFVFDSAVASVKVAKAAKSEGELVITGTKGYIYVPAPWWKTDYFEVRYEDAENNKRYFYQLDGEGIRYEIVAFSRAVENGKSDIFIGKEVTACISEVMEDFYSGDHVRYLS